MARPLDPYGQPPLLINLTQTKILVSMHVISPRLLYPTLTAFLEPQHSRPRPRGQHNLLVLGLCGYNKRDRKPHQHCYFAYPDQAHRGSRTHAI